MGGSVPRSVPRNPMHHAERLAESRSQTGTTPREQCETVQPRGTPTCFNGFTENHPISRSPCGGFLASNFLTHSTCAGTRNLRPNLVGCRKLKYSYRCRTGSRWPNVI